MASALDDALYHQTKTPISFWCRRGLNSRSLIQPSETLPVELTGTHMIYIELNNNFLEWLVRVNILYTIFVIVYNLLRSFRWKFTSLRYNKIFILINSQNVLLLQHKYLFECLDIGNHLRILKLFW